MSAIQALLHTLVDGDGAAQLVAGPDEAAHLQLVIKRGAGTDGRAGLAVGC